ncbi:MAG: asparagine synthase (glutamine-hydrolyzing) [Ignavibacteria bacterium]|nr:asparagine synthase (glutamine-hydrolyzing) [Ignavibacteria bacterium]
MCGIAGKTDWNGSDSSRSAVVREITRSLSHRGPDFEGVLDLENVSLGHRRLSIIDLSEKGNQPMTVPGGRHFIAYNGEVYNFPMLREMLEKESGISFFSHSDTEVILQCYAKYGANCFEMFNGMFAIAIWDEEKKELILARDRFGKKPLYYYVSGSGNVVFASELTSLMLDSSVPKTISPEGINCFLALGYILSPMSLYRDVRKLEPASYIRFSRDKTTAPVRYWNFSDAFRTKTNENEEEIAEHILELLGESVKRRMISDVPVGAFLSGGIDSSSVVAMMKKFHTGELHTFSVGFQSESYNELPDAERISSWIGTVHHSMICNRDNSIEAVNGSIDAFDEPFADNSLIPMVEVSGLASKYVKVVLSGDGADEMFAGYITYKADKYHAFARPVPNALKKLVSSLLSSSGNSKKLNWQYKQRQFLNGAMHDADRAHFMWRQYFTPEERVAILGRENEQLVFDTDPFRIFRKFYDEAEGLSALDRNLYVDCMTWLPDDILVKVDRSAMHWGLEARSPYLDPELACYAASIPAELKMKGFETKYILRKALRKILPGFVLDKKKSGFNAPVGSWLGTNGMDEFRTFNKYVYDRKLR